MLEFELDEVRATLGDDRFWDIVGLYAEYAIELKDKKFYRVRERKG